MDGPEDKGSRYRLVMLVALLALVGPGFFLLNWIGDNGVNNLFRQLMGLDAPRTKVTRVASPNATVVVNGTVVGGSTQTVVTVTPTATAQLSTTATSAPPATSVASSPSAHATPQHTPVATPAPLPPTATAKPPAPTATPTSSGDFLGTGVAVPAYGGAAVMRSEPSTEGAALISIPQGETVRVLGQVEGEAIDPVESRWWHVEYEGTTGYVYYKLIRLE